MAATHLFLRGAKVNRDFHAALHDAANRAGITPNEFCITAAAEKLLATGRSFPGVFTSGDFDVCDIRRPAGPSARAA